MATPFNPYSQQPHPLRHHQSREYYRADHPSTTHYDHRQQSQSGRTGSVPGTPGYHTMHGRSAPINMLNPKYPAALSRDYQHQHNRAALSAQAQGDHLNKEIERALKARKRAEQIRRGTAPLGTKSALPKSPNPIYGPKPESDKPRRSAVGCEQQPYGRASTGQGFNGKRKRRVSFSTMEDRKESKAQVYPSHSTPFRGHDPRSSSRGYYDPPTSGRKENYHPDPSSTPRHHHESRSRRTSLPINVYASQPPSRGHGAVSPISSDTTLCGHNDRSDRKRSSSRQREHSSHHAPKFCNQGEYRTSSSTKRRDHGEYHSSSTKHHQQSRHSTSAITPSRRSSHSPPDPRVMKSSTNTPVDSASKRLAPLSRFNPFSRRARADSLSAVTAEPPIKARRVSACEPPAKTCRVSVDQSAPRTSSKMPGMGERVGSRYFSPFGRKA